MDWHHPWASFIRPSWDFPLFSFFLLYSFFLFVDHLSLLLLFCFLVINCLLYFVLTQLVYFLPIFPATFSISVLPFSHDLLFLTQILLKHYSHPFHLSNSWLFSWIFLCSCYHHFSLRLTFFSFFLLLSFLPIMTCHLHFFIVLVLRAFLILLSFLSFI